ncbi:glycosyltransferase family 2 protein [Microbacter margulisiae]|uniref:Glycosyltransferase involved in cell wall biosynthesis n=1 Tax=Microbacter margulisiae TaxID=1350067 RepID=A0A7W5H2A8_9PORP|nr:glycosyltransferase [Microbacter margulisiae]MBB3187206.1 glycosyltransferase involved in cell wall biosynthesis [Microbacter margulisiae]
MDNEVLLTIAIPTYNRKEFLINNVTHLLPQLNEKVKLLIIDNHSDEIMQDVLYETIPDIKKINIEFIRNRINIGGDANIVRCFEYCTSPYLWILGDDDIPILDAVNKIFNHIILYPEVMFFNFSSEIYFRNKSFRSKGLTGFVDGIDDYSNLLFISCNVYKVPEVIINLRFAYHYIYSCASQIVIILQSLDERSETYFSAEQIVNWGKPSPDRQWSHVLQSLGYYSIIELPSIVKHGLSKKLALKMKMYSPSVKQMFRLIATLSDGPSYNTLTSIYLFDQIMFRRFYFHPFYIRILRYPFRFLLLFPFAILYFYRYVTYFFTRREYRCIKDVYLDD